jgi:pimeloyl-ACP methyl ester carboxylesterase
MKDRIISIFILISITNTINCQEHKAIYDFDLSEVNYEIIGSGKPILMLHGMSVDLHVMKHAFEPNFIEFPHDWKRIYLDLPGMGKTTAFDWIKNSDDMFVFLTKFIDKVIPNEEFVVAGYSYGGYLARGLIAQYETKIIGGIFICPLIIPDDKKRNVQKDIFYNRDTVFCNKLDVQAKALLDYFLVNQDSATISRFSNDILCGHARANRSFIDRIRNNPKNYEFSKKITKNFRPYEKPVLFITAKQDILVGFSDAKGILDYFPNNTFVTIDSAGHAVQIDAQQKFDWEIKKYLIRL